MQYGAVPARGTARPTGNVCPDVFSFRQIEKLTGECFGISDVPCPLCSSQVSVRGARRRVLRVYRQDESFAGFNCARCGAKGWARSGDKGHVPSPERFAEIRCTAATREAAERAESVRKARYLWGRRRPIVPGTPPYTYLREPRGFGGTIPATLGYLAPSRPDHHHAMIAVLGFAHEPDEADPGVLAIADEAVLGVHLTLLQPDGSGKADISESKIIIGKGSAGSPICLAPPNDLLGLVITEGIEDALSMHETTGLGAWAAGCANRLPPLAPAVPSYIDFVTIIADPDDVGKHNTRLLASGLNERGIESQITTLGVERRAA